VPAAALTASARGGFQLGGSGRKDGLQVEQKDEPKKEACYPHETDCKIPITGLRGKVRLCLTTEKDRAASGFARHPSPDQIHIISGKDDYWLASGLVFPHGDGKAFP